MAKLFSENNVISMNARKYLFSSKIGSLINRSTKKKTIAQLFAQIINDLINNGIFEEPIRTENTVLSRF